MSAATILNCKLVILGTDWALTQFGAKGPSTIRTYETGHHFQPVKEAKKVAGPPWR